MSVPSQECDSCFLVVPLVEMVELLVGFVGFCELSVLNAPWSTVPLLLPLSGSAPTDLAYCLTIVLSEICRGQKRSNTLNCNFLFQIILPYFEELKKTKNKKTGRNVSPFLIEELLEKLMLAKTKLKNLWKFY